METVDRETIYRSRNAVQTKPATSVAGDPYASHPDVERVGDGYRVRHGTWRALYTGKDDGDVVVVRVRHRREAYRE